MEQPGRGVEPGRVGRGARQSCAQSRPHHLWVARPRDSSSASLGRSFPVNTMGIMTATSSDWDDKLVGRPSGTQAVCLSLCLVSLLQSTPLCPGHSLSRPAPGARRSLFCPAGGSASFTWVSEPSPGPKELSHPVLPAGESRGQLVPLPDCPASWVQSPVSSSAAEDKCF